MPEENKDTVSVRDHMKNQTENVCGLLDDLINQMRSSETLEKATMSSLASALKIVSEKYASLAETEDEQDEGGVIVLPEIGE